MIARTMMTRIATRTSSLTQNNARMFSNCEPVERIRGVFEEYRKEQ